MHSIPRTRRRARRHLLYSAVAAVFAVAVVLATPVGLLWVLFWAADGAWEFEGQSGVRHWLFIKGKWIDRLGLVEHVGPARYSVSLQEGNFPGWAVLTYDSGAAPATILHTYAERCRKLGLKVTKEPAVWEHGADGMYLECEIETYIDAQFVAERKPPAELTQVSLRVWGRD
jgi:hypothetical protein